MLAVLAVLALTAIASIASTYVWAPIVLYRKNVIDTTDRTRVIEDASAERIHPEMQGYVSGAEHSLLALGFSEPLRYTTSSDSPPDTVASLQEHPIHGDLATIIAIRKETVYTFSDMDGETYEMPNVRRDFSVSFKTRFADGVELVTYNSGLVRFWPDRPGQRLVRFPEIVDAAELYGLHRARVLDRARVRPLLSLTRGSTPEQRLSHERRDAQGFHENLVQCGYRRRTPNGLRCTARGAALSAWRHAWPWRAISGYVERRRARAVLRAAHGSP
jgi:hypothetical protein